MTRALQLHTNAFPPLPAAPRLLFGLLRHPLLPALYLSHSLSLSLCLPVRVSVSPIPSLCARSVTPCVCFTCTRGRAFSSVLLISLVICGSQPLPLPSVRLFVVPLSLVSCFRLVFPCRTHRGSLVTGSSRSPRSSSSLPSSLPPLPARPHTPTLSCAGVQVAPLLSWLHLVQCSYDCSCRRRVRTRRSPCMWACRRMRDQV